jgi:hypothetical protein
VENISQQAVVLNSNPILMYKTLLLALLFYANTISAQKKVDLDRFSFTATFRTLPAIKLDSTYRTYNVEVEGTKAMRYFLRELNPEESVVIDGWKKLPRHGHLSVKVNLDDLLPEAITVKERIQETKDKTGKVVGIKTFYYQEVTYSFAAKAIVTDYKGAHVTEHELASRANKKTYRSPEFSNREIATGYFMLNAVKVTNDLYRNCVNQSLNSLSDQISYNFGFGTATVRDFMWIIDSRKHPEYNAHRKAFLEFNNVIFSFDANTPIADARARLKPMIDYFEKIKRTYTSNSKHDRKIRYASFYNLAVLYYYLDDPQMMMKEASGLVLNDFDAKDGTVFEQTALRLKNQFLTSNYNTRHFTIDTTLFRGPYESQDKAMR